MPGGEEHQGRRRGLVEPEPIGNGNGRIFWRRHEFTISAMNTGAEHGIAPAAIVMPGNAQSTLAATESRREQNALPHLHALAKLAHLHHFAGDIASENVRHWILQGNAGPYP